MCRAHGGGRQHSRLFLGGIRALTHSLRRDSLTFMDIVLLLCFREGFSVSLFSLSVFGNIHLSLFQEIFTLSQFLGIFSLIVTGRIDSPRGSRVNLSSSSGDSV